MLRLKKILELLKLFTIPIFAIILLYEYRKTSFYILMKRGLRSLWRFLFVKLFINDEGGQYGLLNSVYRLFPNIIRHPFKVEVEVTTICNKKCLLCEHTYWKEPSQRVSFEEFKNIVDQFPNLIWSNVTGEGSGFLNKDYLKMIRYLRERDVSVNFVDEFDFLVEEKAREVIRLGVNSVMVSMDGATKETYEKIKVGCNFDRVIRNIKRFIDLKKDIGAPNPTLYFRFIVNKLNVHELPQFVELIHSFGDRGEGSRTEFAGLLTFPEVEHLYLHDIPQNILDETRKTAKSLGEKVSFAHAWKLAPVSRCSAWSEPYIMIGGYVMPCCAVLMSNRRDFLRKHSFGNLNEKSMAEIWNSEKYRRFRQDVPQDEGPVSILCHDCRAFDNSERVKKYGIYE